MTDYGTATDRAVYEPEAIVHWRAVSERAAATHLL